MFLPNSFEQQSHPHCESGKILKDPTQRSLGREHFSERTLQALLFQLRERSRDSLTSHSAEGQRLKKLKPQLRKPCFACMIYLLGVYLLGVSLLGVYLLGVIFSEKLIHFVDEKPPLPGKFRSCL